MKKVICLVLALAVMSATVTAVAADVPQYSCEMLDDGTLSINAYMGDETDVVLPQTLYNMSVTAIGSNAFKKHRTLESITVPVGYRIISDYAFMNSPLRAVSLPDGLLRIGESAFRGCRSLNEIIIPGTVATMAGSVFTECTSLERAVIGRGVTTISAAAFAGCTSLAAVELPDTVTAINGRAFANCTALREIYIPESVANIYANAFDGCKSLTVKCRPGSAAHEFAVSNSLDVSLICDHKNTEVRGSVNVSCNVPGYTGDVWCLDCNTMITKGEDISPNGRHVDADGVMNADADGHFYVCGCGAEFGREEHSGGTAYCKTGAICAVCRAEYGPTDPLNHKNTEKRNALDPTYKTEGWTGDVYCTDCGTLVEEGEPIPKLPLRGDANGDGAVSVADAIFILKIVSGWKIEHNIGCCDADGDGKISVADAVLILKLVAGWNM